MSVLNQGINSLRGAFGPIKDRIRKQILGANNERLDFIMDSFYKLSPKQQSAVAMTVVAGMAMLVICIVAIYFSRLDTLEKDLNSGYEALRNLRTQGQEYKVASAKMEWLKNRVETNSSFKPKPHFARLAENIGIKIESLRSEEVNIPQDSPLATRFKEVHINFRLPKVSIPRLLQFLTEIEKSNQSLTVRDLKIRSRFEDRLYFDVEALVATYVLKAKGA